mmetsp:Transcript_3462/g.6112  ORF Transcript_3462/g.6112 Transcript_3462/m.6112 type:complete len:274 (+) Transcript_3462:85-906(+)
MNGGDEARQSPPSDSFQGSAAAGLKWHQWLTTYPVAEAPELKDRLLQMDRKVFKINHYRRLRWDEKWPLHFAAIKGDIETINTLLQQKPDNPDEINVDSGYLTPLQTAASLGQMGAMIAFILHGADPLLPPNHNGVTTMSLAADQDELGHIVSFLEQYSLQGFSVADYYEYVGLPSPRKDRPHHSGDPNVEKKKKIGGPSCHSMKANHVSLLQLPTRTNKYGNPPPSLSTLVGMCSGHSTTPPCGVMCRACALPCGKAEAPMKSCAMPTTLGR